LIEPTPERVGENVWFMAPSALRPFLPQDFMGMRTSFIPLINPGSSIETVAPEGNPVPDKVLH